MPVLADAREERFAQGLLKGLSQGSAFISAGFAAKTQASAAVQANVMLKKRPHINARLNELKSEALRIILETEFKGDIQELARMFLEDRVDARAAGQYAAAISAVNGLVKLFNRGGETVNVTVLTKDQRDAAVAAALNADR